MRLDEERYSKINSLNVLASAISLMRDINASRDSLEEFCLENGSFIGPDIVDSIRELEGTLNGIVISLGKITDSIGSKVDKVFAGELQFPKYQELRLNRKYIAREFARAYMLKLPGDKLRYFLPKRLSELDEKRNELVIRYFPGFQVISSIRTKDGNVKRSISIDEFLIKVQKSSRGKEKEKKAVDLCTENTNEYVDQEMVVL